MNEDVCNLPYHFCNGNFIQRAHPLFNCRTVIVTYITLTSAVTLFQSAYLCICSFRAKGLKLNQIPRDLPTCIHLITSDFGMEFETTKTQNKRVVNMMAPFLETVSISARFYQ